MSSLLKRALRAYAIYFSLWTVLGLFFFSQALTQKLYFHDPTPWWQTMESWLIGVWVSALLTPAVLWLGQRFPLERGKWMRSVPLHLIFGLLFAVVQLTMDSFVHARLGVLPFILGSTFKAVFSILMVIAFHGDVLTYWTILGIQSAIRYYRRYQEREKQALRLELQASELQSQLMQARLGALKMQLQPHFLFNTLNTIMVLVRQQKGRQAEEMLGRLSDLLRCVLDDVEAQEVPLRRELEYLQLYLSIEQVRFQDRLRVEISADPAILDAAVPQMGLQPIVENAIRHGIGRSSAAGKIQITAARVNGMLEVKVQDDGPGLPPAGAATSRGIGLANTRLRLHQLYGDAARLTAQNGEHGGAVITMLIPYHVAPGVSESEVMEIHALDHANR
ncbi:MAG TPA: histidine kinase [Candidatus Angelobacter sp.]